MGKLKVIATPTRRGKSFTELVAEIKSLYPVFMDQIRPLLRNASKQSFMKILRNTPAMIVPLVLQLLENVAPGIMNDQHYEEAIRRVATWKRPKLLEMLFSSPYKEAQEAVKNFHNNPVIEKLLEQKNPSLEQLWLALRTVNPEAIPELVLHLPYLNGAMQELAYERTPHELQDELELCLLQNALSKPAISYEQAGKYSANVLAAPRTALDVFLNEQEVVNQLREGRSIPLKPFSQTAYSQGRGAYSQPLPEHVINLYK